MIQDLVAQCVIWLVLSSLNPGIVFAQENAWHFSFMENSLQVAKGKEPPLVIPERLLDNPKRTTLFVKMESFEVKTRPSPGYRVIIVLYRDQKEDFLESFRSYGQKFYSHWPDFFCEEDLESVFYGFSSSDHFGLFYISSLNGTPFLIHTMAFKKGIDESKQFVLACIKELVQANKTVK